MRVCQALQFTVGGLKLCGIRWPSANETAPRLLAVHGWLDNANSFVPLAQYLPHWHVVAMDLPGHGQSQHRSVDAGYHFIDWIGSIVGILDALQWPRAVLVGHSMGAAVAALVAGTVPQRLAGLVLLDAVGPRTGEAGALPGHLAQHLEHLRRRAGRPLRPYANVAEAAQTLCRVVPLLSLPNALLLAQRNVKTLPGGAVVWCSDARLRQSVISTLSPDQVRAFFQRVACPSLLVYAPDGGLCDPVHMQAQIASIAELAVVPVRGGHHLHMQRPQAVADTMAPLLAASAPFATPPATQEADISAPGDRPAKLPPQ